MPETNTEIKKSRQRKSLYHNGKRPADKVLYGTPHLKLICHSSYFEVNCFDENPLKKKELVSFLSHEKKILKEGFNNKILVTINNGWTMNIDAWSLLVKMEF